MSLFEGVLPSEVAQMEVAVRKYMIDTKMSMPKNLKIETRHARKDPEGVYYATIIIRGFSAAAPIASSTWVFTKTEDGFETDR